MTEFSLERFSNLEIENDLYTLDVDGINPWELVRFEVARRVDQALTGQAAAHDSPTGIKAYIKAAWLVSRNLVIKNPFWSDEHRFLFFGHPRRKRERDGYWWDLYCDPIYEETDIDYLHLEYSDFLSHKTPSKTESIRYTDLIDLIGVLAGKSGILSDELSAPIMNKISSMEEDVAAEYNINVDIHDLVREKLSERAVAYPLYDRVIQRVDPEFVIVVVNYGRGMKTIIEVCKNKNIPVIELQHGVIHPNHAGYDFPENVTVDLFPDYLLTFGEFWNTQATYPITPDRIITFGYPYLTRRLRSIDNESGTKKILFVSQGPVGKQLSQIAVELTERIDPSWDIVYKLHPGEYDRWKREYTTLADSTVTVVDTEPSLYELFAESSIQIGVGSTALYEGLAFDLDTYVFDLPSSSILDPIVAEGGARKVASVAELAEGITSGGSGEVCVSDIFYTNRKERIITIIGEIKKNTNTTKSGRIN